MKKLLTLLTIYLFIHPAFSQIRKINSQTDWKQAKEDAQKHSKSVFVDFYTDWCGPCKQMDRLVFNQDSIRDELQKHFILLKVNAESNFGQLLKKQYKVVAYPTYLFLDEQAIPYYYVVGFKDLTLFNNEVNNALRKLEDNKPISYYYKLYPNKSHDPHFIKAYANKLIYSQSDSLLNVVLKQYFAAIAKTEINTPDNIELLASYVKNCQDPLFPFLESARYKPYKEEKLSIKISQSYQAAIAKCHSEAIDKRDTTILNLAIGIIARDSLNLDRQYTIMSKRLTYFQNTEQYELYYKWVAVYMNNMKNITINDLTQQGLLAYNKVFRNNLAQAPDQEDFIQRWVKTDTESIANQLNSHARNFYKKRSKQDELENALRWSQRSCELFLLPEHVDTYAHLLYKLNKKEEAIFQQKKAIELAVQSNQDKQPFESELKKMQEDSN